MPGDGEQVMEVLHFWFAESLPRQIWLMPLMHKEDLAVQEVALPLFERFSDPRTAYFARSHWDVIARFGRFTGLRQFGDAKRSGPRHHLVLMQFLHHFLRIPLCYDRQPRTNHRSGGSAGGFPRRPGSPGRLGG
jgi:hypothetical protein